MLWRTLAVIVTWGLLVPPAVMAQARGERLSGDVVKLESGVLTLSNVAGQPLAIALADNARVTYRMPGDLAKLQEGLYVGVTATPQPDGTLLASQVSVFPESLRGTAEGHRPMADLPGSTMTNATVRNIATTTNASVTGASDTGNARRLVVSYTGGEKTVIVPATAAVVFSEIAGREALAPGAHVIVYATRRPDGSLVTERISVGKNGTVPRS